MIFKELQVKNFIPYKGSQTVEFPTGKSKNVLIVFSDNEGGKTSLFNAIRWVLYGKAITRHKAEIGLHQIFNKEAAEERENEFFVKLDYEADGINYSLKRIATKKPGVVIPTKNDDFEISLFLNKNGQEIALPQIDFEINRYLPEQVSRFFLFDGELLGEYEMLLDESNDKGRQIKTAIEQALGVPSLSKGKLDFETLRRDADKRYTTEIAKQGNLDRLIDQKRMLYETEATHKRSLDQSKIQLQNIQDEKKLIDDEIDDLSKSSEIAQQIKTNKLTIKLYENQITEVKQRLLVLHSDSYKDLLKPTLIDLEKKLIAELNPVREKYHSIGSINFELNQIKNLLETNHCPLCEQNYSHDNSKDILLKEKIDLLQKKLSDTENEEGALGEIGMRLESIRKLLTSTVLEKIKLEKSNLTSLSVNITKLENKNEELQSQLDGKSEDLLIKKQARHDQLVGEEAVILKTIKDENESIDKLQKQIDEIEEKIKQAADPKARNSRAALLVDAYKKIENSFKDSIDKLREKLKLEVQQKASEAFLELTNQPAYTGLKINSNYGLTILDPDGNDVALRSAGAEQIVALSLIDGLSRTGRSAGPVIMDTPFARLDPNHRKNILRYLPKTASQFILFVHEGEVSKDQAVEFLSQRIGMQYEITRESVYRSKLVRI